MKKIRVKIVVLGHIPHSLNLAKIINWESALFELVSPVDNVSIVTNSDGNDWEFTDDNISNHLLGEFEGDILLALTNVALEDNYYLRRFSENKACLTFYEVSDFLKQENIPIENFILRALYAASFVYKRYSNKIPLSSEYTDYGHDDTRGCIFDMNGIKNDIIYSTNQPKICPECVVKLKNSHIAGNLISQVQDEISKIRKDRYYIILDFIKNNPIWALIISIATALITGIIGSIVSSFIYDKIK